MTKLETLEDMAARLADLSNGDPVLETEILDALHTVEERCQEFLTAAETDNKKLRDALAEAEADLDEVKERRLETVGMCDQLMIELVQARAEVARLEEELTVIRVRNAG